MQNNTFMEWENKTKEKIKYKAVMDSYIITSY